MIKYLKVEKVELKVNASSGYVYGKLVPSWCTINQKIKNVTIFSTQIFYQHYCRMPEQNSINDAWIAFYCSGNKHSTITKYLKTIKINDIISYDTTVYDTTT